MVITNLDADGIFDRKACQECGQLVPPDRYIAHQDIQARPVTEVAAAPKSIGEQDKAIRLLRAG